MKKIIVPILIGLVCGFSQSHAVASETFQASLTGDQVAPTPVVTDAFGTATFTLNDTMDALSYSIQLFGLDIDGLQTLGDSSDDVIALHVHSGTPGTEGPGVFPIINPPGDMDLIINGAAGTLMGIWSSGDLGPGLASQLNNLRNGLLYVNIHTGAFDEGEIRGQIIPEPSTSALILSALVGLAGLRYRKS